MTRNSDASKMLAAASSRLLELAEKGERRFVGELLRRFVEAGRDGAGIEEDHAESDRGTVDYPPDPAGGLADAKRMRDAIDVALALLDEIFELVPHEPRQVVAQDIADIFHEISEIAALGERGAESAS